LCKKNFRNLQNDNLINMNIIGINAYHGDSSACIFQQNELIAAAEEERFTRLKHHAGLPINSIKYCLEYSKLSIDQIDEIAINRNPKKRLFSKILFSAKKIIKFNFLNERLKNLKKINDIKKKIENAFGKKINTNISFIDHHEAHIASAVFFSKFNECNFISVDGFGDFASTVVGKFNNNKIIKNYEVLFPHSLGLFYTAITQFLGFKNYGDEYKVMGLAAYGKPTFLEQMRKILIKKNNKGFELNLDYFVHHTKGIEMTWLDTEPRFGNVYSSKLAELLGEERKKDQKLEQKHKDIAHSAQKFFEDILVEIANDIYAKNKTDNLCISGGCGMNSVANGKIKLKTPYKNIYIPPAPGDAGGAIGAASLIIKKQNSKTSFDDNPYLGPKFEDSEIFQIIDKNINNFKKSNIEITKFSNKKDLLKELAKLISENKIIGFFNDRMEWGPRALGNRSILANPGEKKIREILNLKIKRRESFRPFAPSILREYVKEWFEQDEEVPFMSQVFQIKKDKRMLIPAVTHVDGSGRLQTVQKNINPNFYQLIEYFKEITNIPMVLNTSFNENEPIVCNPDEAIDCFLRTQMDALALENTLLTRRN